MGRNLVWSVLLHVAVIVSGALVAPLGTFGDSPIRPMDIINVGLVASAPKAPGPAVPIPQIQPPEPAMDDAVAIKPESDLTKEQVQPEKKPEPVPEKPKEDEKKPEEPEKPAKEEPKEGSKRAKADTVTTQQLAQNDATGSITDGSGSGGDVWGVETDVSVNPYHRQGFIAVRNNWRNPATGPRPLKCTVRFRIKRSGELDDVVLERPSGNPLFDRQAVRAVKMTGSWEPFPKFWEEDEQIIHLEFEYRP